MTISPFAMTETADLSNTSATTDVPGAPLWAFYAYFLRLGATGFGGPIALAGFPAYVLATRSLVDVWTVRT
jgi:hypothetical protein